MNDQRDEEEQERPRPRVVDKRVSSRGSDAASIPEAPTPEPPAGSSPPSGAEAPVDVSPPPREAPVPPPPARGDAPPSGEVPPARGDAPPSGEVPPRGAQDVWTPEQEAEMQRLTQEIAQRPSVEWVVNTALTLVNVAGTKLEIGQASDAQLAIDALSGLLQSAGGRLESAEQPLRQALAELQLVFAQKAAPSPPDQS